MKSWTWHGQFFGSTILAGVLFSTPAIGLAQEVAVDNRVQHLEQRVLELQDEARRGRHIELVSLEERLERLEQSRSAAQSGATGNQVFFRGGGAFATSDRSGEVFTDTFGLSGTNGGDTGYYVGAGLDLVLSKDVWGMMSNTTVLGEVGVEFRRFNSKNVQQAVPSTCAVAGVSTCPLTVDKVQITMLTVDIAPKIKFFEGSRLRPWIIPIGLDFIVISPPSNDTTYLDLGVQFGAGVEYQIFKAFHIGLDGRFHLASNQTDTVNNVGTVGTYIGIEF